MAMRNLLRRIPALAPSGPLMRPVHGVSPAMAAAVPAPSGPLMRPVHGVSPAVPAPSGPLMRPVHGVSPARAAAVIPRFLSTQSEGGHGSRKSALDAYLESEEEAARTWKLIDAKHKEIMETNKKIRLEIDQLEEDGNCHIKSVNDLGINHTIVKSMGHVQ